MGNILGRRANSYDVSLPQPESLGTTDQDQDLNICWRNIPPQASVYWAYSGVSDRNSYYFMPDSVEVEQAYQQGDERFTFCNGAYIDFKQMIQHTSQAGRTRDVRRITSERLLALRDRYLASLDTRSHNWCLDCRSGYVLYSPAIQLVLDKAYAEGQTVTITQCYSYDIDPLHGTQRNINTGKVRKVVRLFRGTNSKPIYGPYLVMIPASTELSPVNPETLATPLVVPGSDVSPGADAPHTHADPPPSTSDAHSTSDGDSDAPPITADVHVDIPRTDCDSDSSDMDSDTDSDTDSSIYNSTTPARCPVAYASDDNNSQ